MMSARSLMDILRKFGELEGLIISDAVTADGERISCIEVKMRMKEGVRLEDLLVLLKMNSFNVESFSRRGLKVKLVIIS